MTSNQTKCKKWHFLKVHPGQIMRKYAKPFIRNEFTWFLRKNTNGAKRNVCELRGAQEGRVMWCKRKIDFMDESFFFFFTMMHSTHFPPPPSLFPNVIQVLKSFGGLGLEFIFSHFLVTLITQQNENNRLANILFLFLLHFFLVSGYPPDSCFSSVNYFSLVLQQSKSSLFSKNSWNERIPCCSFRM